jgi:hypothetical protein
MLAAQLKGSDTIAGNGFGGSVAISGTTDRKANPNGRKAPHSVSKRGNPPHTGAPTQGVWRPFRFVACATNGPCGG